MISIDRCVLVALVDQGVELLEHPVGAFLRTEVVDVEKVDRGEPLEEGGVGVASGLASRRSGGSGQAASAASRSRPSGPPPAPPSRPASPASSCRCRSRRTARDPCLFERSSSSSTKLLDRSRPPPWSRGPAPCRRPAGGRRRRRGSAAGSPRRRRCSRPRFRRCSRHSQGRATSSGPRIQPEPSQTPSGQACSRKGSLRAIAIRSQAPRPPRPPSAALPRPAARSAAPGRSSRRTSGSGRGRPASARRSGRSCAWR